MDRRFFLALLLTMGVIVVTPRLFPADPRPAAVTPADTSAAVGATPTNTTVPGAAASAANAGTVAPAPQAGPAAAAPAVAARTLRLSNALATYEFSTRGATFLRAELPGYPRLVGDSAAATLVDRMAPLVRYRVLAGRDTIALDALDFSAVADTVDGKPRLTFTAPVGTGSAQISYTLATDEYLADVAIAVTGVPQPAFLFTDLPSSFDTQESDSLDDRRHLAYAMRTPTDGASRIDFRKPDPGERLTRQGPFTWAVAKNKYFVVGFLAKDSAASPLAELHVTGAIRENKVATRAQGTLISPIGANAIELQLFAGPQQWQRLVGLGREFEHVNPYGGWFSGVVQPFATIVMRLLLWMKATTALGYGWILVIFGIAVRLLMWPLNSRMMRSQLVMQRITPAIQAAQNKHKGDPLRQREEVMKVYADAGISPFAPLAGCLPMLIPMPVLFALFFVFQNTIEFRGVPFLWFPDISVKDPLYIAPVLTGASMFLLSWLGMRNVPPNPQAKMMLWMMPIMMTVLGINFAAGLNLYWFVQNFAAMPQQWLIANERGKAAPVTPVASSGVAVDGGGRKRR